MSKSASLKETPASPILPSLVLLSFKPSGRLAEVFQAWKLDPTVQLNQVRGSADAIAVLKDSSCTGLLVHLMDVAEVKELAKVVIPFREKVNNGQIELVVINSVPDSKVAGILKAMGCREIVNASILTTGLNRRLRRYFDEQTSKGKIDAPLRPLNIISSNVASRVVNVEALDSPHDCWIIAKETVRFVQGQWIIYAMGPAPSIGRWVDAKLGEEKGESWRWVPHFPEEDPFAHGGDWVFYGQIPTFMNDRWSFIGKTPKLVFINAMLEELAVRFSMDGSERLLIAKNSTFAQGKIPYMTASLEYSIFFRGEAGGVRESFLKYFERNKAKYLPNRTLDQNSGNTGPILEIEKKGIPNERKMQLFVKAELKMGARDKLFAPVVDRKMHEEYCTESIGICSPVTLWTDLQKLRRETTIQQGNARDNLLMVNYPAGFDRNSFEKELERLQAKRLFFNILLPRSSLFLSHENSRYQLKATGIEIDISGVVFEVQRRNQFRHKIPQEIAFNVTIGNKVFKVRDISAGGMCFALDSNVKSLYQIGEQIPSLSFDIYGQKIHCAAQVRWTAPSKVGVQFQRLSAQDTLTVRLYVLEESFEYLQKYVVNEEE